MIKSLSDMKPGDFGMIVKVGGEGKIRRRLFDMGVTPGADVIFKKRAPLGDPLEISLRGYELGLRHTEARLIQVEVKEVEKI